MKIDKFLVAVTISIFLLAGLFNLAYEIYAGLDIDFSLYGLVPAGFLGWATFYAKGGGKDAVTSGIPANMSGILWGVVIVLIWNHIFSFNLVGAFVAVAVGAGAMCFQAHLKWFGFIPGAFIGASTFFALGARIEGDVLFPAIIGLIMGVLLGYVSEVFAKSIHKKISA